MKLITTLIRRVLPKNQFARGVSVLVVGTVFAQGMLVLASPVLTRLYSPQDFGLMAVFTALLSMVVVVASLRYELAIPMPDSDDEAAALFVLSMVTVLAVAAASAVPILWYRNEIAQLCNTPALAGYLYLVPLGAVFAGAYNVLNFWAIRSKAFAPLAKTKISQSIAAVALQLGGASLGPVALLVGQVAGHASGSLSLSLRVLRRQWKLVAGVRPWRMALVARRYKSFPLFSTWCAVFNTAGAQLPAVLFAMLFDSAAAGIYGLAYRVLSMPMQLLGQAIGNVFFSAAAQAHRNGKLPSLVARIHARLAHIGMPPMLVLVVAGPEVFVLAFGPEWKEAGVFAQWLAPWLYLVFITSPLSVVFEVLEKQGVGMVYQGVMLVVRAAAIIAGASFGDVMTAVALFVLGNCACTFANLMSVIRLSGNTWDDIWRPSLGALAWALVLVSPVICSSVCGSDRSLWLFALAATFLLIAARYTWLMKKAWL